VSIFRPTKGPGTHSCHRHSRGTQELRDLSFQTRRLRVVVVAHSSS